MRYFRNSATGVLTLELGNGVQVILNGEAARDDFYELTCGLAGVDNHEAAAALASVIRAAVGDGVAVDGFAALRDEQETSGRSFAARSRLRRAAAEIYFPDPEAEISHL